MRNIIALWNVSSQHICRLLKNFLVAMDNVMNKLFVVFLNTRNSRMPMKDRCVKQVLGFFAIVLINFLIIFAYLHLQKAPLSKQVIIVKYQETGLPDQDRERRDNSHTSSILEWPILRFNDSFPVHLFRYYDFPPGADKGSLCHTECISLLSILNFLKPREIFFHTNYPDFWPFDTCEKYINKWDGLQIVPHRRQFIIGGRRIIHDLIHHEVDLAKLMVMERFGGIAVDFDVYILPNITSIFPILSAGSAYECVGSRESLNLMNMGFMACRKNAGYVREILKRYEENYSKSWLYSSGYVPMQLLKQNDTLRKTVYVDDGIANEPSNVEKTEHDKRLENWDGRLAYHSFFHDCAFNASSKEPKNLAKLFKFIRETSLTD